MKKLQQIAGAAPDTARVQPHEYSLGWDLRKGQMLISAASIHACAHPAHVHDINFDLVDSFSSILSSISL